MVNEAIRPTTSDTLAATVRECAAQARQALSDPAAGRPAAGLLAGRISRLQDQVRDLSSSDLARWLESLRQRVEDDLKLVA